MTGNERAEVHALGGARRLPPRKLPKDLRPDLIASAADGGTEVHAKPAHGEAALGQSFNTVLDDASGGSTPA